MQPAIKWIDCFMSALASAYYIKETKETLAKQRKIFKKGGFTWLQCLEKLTGIVKVYKEESQLPKKGKRPGGDKKATARHR